MLDVKADCKEIQYQDSGYENEGETGDGVDEVDDISTPDGPEDEYMDVDEEWEKPP